MCSAFLVPPVLVFSPSFVFVFNRLFAFCRRKRNRAVPVLGSPVSHPASVVSFFCGSFFNIWMEQDHIQEDPEEPVDRGLLWHPLCHEPPQLSPLHLVPPLSTINFLFLFSFIYVSSGVSYPLDSSFFVSLRQVRTSLCVAQQPHGVDHQRDGRRD